MWRKEDAALAVVAQPVDVFGADHLDTAIIGVAVDVAEVRVLADDAAEIVPHAPHDGADRSAVELGKSAAEVALRAPRDGEPGADDAAEEAADGGGAVEGQAGEEGEGEPYRERLGDIAQPRRPLAAGDARSRFAGHHRRRSQPPFKAGSRTRSSAPGSSNSSEIGTAVTMA